MLVQDPRTRPAPGQSPKFWQLKLAKMLPTFCIAPMSSKGDDDDDSQLARQMGVTQWAGSWSSFVHLSWTWD